MASVLPDSVSLVLAAFVALASDDVKCVRFAFVRIAPCSKCYRAIYRRARNRVTHQRRMAMGGTRVGPQAIGEYLVRMRERYEQAAAGREGAAPG